MAKLYSDLHYSLSPDRLGKLGLVEGDEAISASIDIILSTPIGSRKFLPEFGSNLNELIFEIIDEGSTIQIQHEIKRAVSKWEPRLKLNNVNVSVDLEKEEIIVNLSGVLESLREFSYDKRILSN